MVGRVEQVVPGRQVVSGRQVVLAVLKVQAACHHELLSTTLRPTSTTQLHNLTLASTEASLQQDGMGQQQLLSSRASWGSSDRPLPQGKERSPWAPWQV